MTITRWLAPLIVVAGPLTAQQIPAPSDHSGAVQRAMAHYDDAVVSVLAAREALTRDDLPTFENAVRTYRRVMPFLIVWQGRACWRADYEGANVAYPVQATMGEALMGWGMMDSMPEAGREMMRETIASTLTGHAEMLNNTRAEWMERCGTTP